MTIRHRGSPEGGFDVQGDPDFPVNAGRMCIKGFTSAQLLDHPARLLSPMVRATDGRLRSATWDAALDAVAERLLSLAPIPWPPLAAAR